jgi:putative ABC transport system ATP-binding protein/lipoprotein-releasing system ATP-binding protein
MGEPLVRASGIGRSYAHGSGRVDAVRAASFTIDDADTIAVVGPSGSGKSTLLHLVAGLESPTAGSITWPAIGDRAALRPGPIGIAFQGPSLLPPLTVVENVALPAILAGQTEADASRAALELLEAFGAAELTERLPEELSGGQAQRVGFARAFAGSPRLVLADEPTGQLDATGGAAIMTVALALTERRRSALVVATHDAAIAQRLDARWVMRDGTLHREAVPSSA